MSGDVYEIEDCVPGMSCRCISDYSCEDWVAIPRAQHEALISDQAELVSLKLYIEELERKNAALMAAANAHQEIVRIRDNVLPGSEGAQLSNVSRKVLRALRAAGIDLKDKP